MLYFSIDTVLSLDRFSPQMSPPYVPSVSVYRVDCVSMMTPMTPYFNYKIGVRRKERGLKLCCPSPDYRRFVNMYEFHILKSFYDPKKICDNMCLYVLTQSLNKQWLKLLKSIDCTRLCNHKYAIFSFNASYKTFYDSYQQKIYGKNKRCSILILSTKRTQAHCTQILSTLFTCLHVMINTDVKQNKLQTWCQQRNKSLKS